MAELGRQNLGRALVNIGLEPVRRRVGIAEWRWRWHYQGYVDSVRRANQSRAVSRDDRAHRALANDVRGLGKCRSTAPKHENST